jgi:hypothetical protein
MHPQGFVAVEYHGADCSAHLPHVGPCMLYGVLPITVDQQAWQACRAVIAMPALPGSAQACTLCSALIRLYQRQSMLSAELLVSQFSCMQSPVADSGSAEQGPSTSSVVVRGNTICRDDNAC